MKLEQFEQVLEVAKTGTFSKAAKNLYMSQPNLSLSIKQLEQELGCALFVRTSGGVAPTEKGKELIEHMAAIQNQYDLLRMYGANQEPSRLPLRIATVNLNRCISYFLHVAKKYMTSPVNFSYINCVTVDDAIHRVETSQADLAVFGFMEHYRKSTLAKIESLNMQYTRIAQSAVVAMIGPQNAYYETKSTLSVQDLVSQTVLTHSNMALDPASAMFDFYYSGITCRGRFTTNNNYLFYELIQETDALGLVSNAPGNRRSYQQKYWPDIRCIPLTDYPNSGEFGWIKLRRMPLSEIAQEFIRELTSEHDEC